MVQKAKRDFLRVDRGTCGRFAGIRYSWGIFCEVLKSEIKRTNMLYKTHSYSSVCVCLLNYKMKVLFWTHKTNQISAYFTSHHQPVSFQPLYVCHAKSALLGFKKANCFFGVRSCTCTKCTFGSNYVSSSDLFLECSHICCSLFI